MHVFLQLCHHSKKHVSLQAKEKYQEGSGGVTERSRVLSEVKHLHIVSFACFKKYSESWRSVFAAL